MATASDCLTTALLNVNGLTRNFDGIKILLIEKKIDVLVLSHIGLVTEDDIQIEGFDVLWKYFEDTAEKDQPDHGVAVYIKKSLDWRRKASYECSDLEVIWVNLRFPKKKDIFLGCCCRKEPTTEDYLNDICETMERVSGSIRFRNIFFMGDFNVDWLIDSDDKTQLQQKATEYGFTQIVSESTNERNPGTCKDHIYTSAPGNCQIPDVDFSDHKLLYVTVSLTDAPGDDPGDGMATPTSAVHKDQLTIGFWNVNSLRNNIEEVRQLTEREKIDVMALCGTRLDSQTTENINIVGFHPPERKDREEPGGGVAIYVKENLTYTRFREDNNPNIEIIWVELSLPEKKPVLVGCCFRVKDKPLEYLEEICNIIRELSTEKDKDIFLVGTFNINWFATFTREIKNKERLETAARTSGLRQIVSETSIEGNPGSCMDHIYTNVPADRHTIRSSVQRLKAHKCLYVTFTSADQPNLPEEDETSTAIANLNIRES
ncbi:uncharacterized protein LOC103153699 [Poecilia formosa]|uniref:uncharacterized protein LOC103153699 n=1 Tax=Poecilia formosa TaxID=48698 RepID=UPI0004448EC3|nr:PREDICTED: uncharacterized protein LOC103153699 [Poecilia formosa]